MLILALACDYDETLAANGQIEPRTGRALARLKESGCKLVLVTGRQLDDLLQVCPDCNLFDIVIAENGAVMYKPSSDQTRLLADKPSEQFLERLQKLGVKPLAIGHSIVATVQQHHLAVSSTIAEMGLDLEIIFNRDSLMVLPTGVNKATGLSLALEALEVPPASVVGVGDAENDAAFLEMCGLSVAVANALPSIREAADIVTAEDHGAGVVEVINKVISGDLLGMRTPAQR
jgi:hydroxymethylpyrimidine pyrophosphatase-like HAD family hydrolase